MSTFEKLSKIDCSSHIEKKGRFSYLSWTWAWSTLKEHAPDATFKKKLFQGPDLTELPYMLAPDGNAYVQVTVTVEGVDMSEIFPVLNHSNKSIQNPNSFDVNTALQRCLVKAIAFHGLGLYIYAGEDLPSDDAPKKTDKVISKLQADALMTLMTATDTIEAPLCSHLGIESIVKMPVGTFDTAMKALEDKQRKMK